MQLLNLRVNAFDVSCQENYAGLDVTSIYKPSISSREYPILDTHPKTSEEMLIEAVENDPDFWNNDLDDADDMTPAHIFGTNGAASGLCLRRVLITSR